jgi:CBS domain containing-hemolysin-like protein
MAVTWTIIVGLILITALYVAAEFAAVSVRRSRLRRLADDGNRLAGHLLPIVEDGRQLDRYIAASQIGITLGSLVLGAYGQATLSDAVAPWLTRAGFDAAGADAAAPAVVLVALTALGVVFGELIPKTLALQYPTESALATVLPMRWSLRLFAPFIAFLNGSGVLLLKFFGVRNTGHRHIHSPEEIDLLIAESRDGGLLEPEEQVRLHRALRLGLRTARELMVPRESVAAISADLPFDQVVEAIASSPYTRLLAYRNSLDNVLGIVGTKDVVVHWATHGGTGQLEPLLRPVARVREDIPADRLLSYLRLQRSHQAIVIDGQGRLAGLITLEDVLGELLGRAPDELKGARKASGG